MIENDKKTFRPKNGGHFSDRPGTAHPAGNHTRPYGEKREGHSFGNTARPSFGRHTAPAGSAVRTGAPEDRKPFAKSPLGDKKPYAAPGRRPDGRSAFPRPVNHVPVETTGLTVNARRIALDILTDVHKNGAFASLSLDDRLKNTAMKPEDRRLVTNIVYGTLENELKIDYALSKWMDHPTNDPVQMDVLRMSAYQILFLDRVPDSAAVNEAVKLVKVMGMESSSGFINAVLRNLVRGKAAIDWPKPEDDYSRYLSIEGSMPLWLTEKLIEAYGEETARQLILYREKEHPIVVRPNMLKMDDAAFEKLLQKKAWRVGKALAPHAWLVYGAQEITLDNDYRSGLFSIQGQSSMLAAEAVQARPGMKILDACAAPGGKSAYLCETMQLTGRVYSWELHEKRTLLLEGVRRRLGLENMRIAVKDATVFREDMVNSLDAVLLDAPCSGTGVLAQKPDVKLRLKPEDLPSIVETQKKLLDTVCQYVQRNGVLVYSTCSVLPEENIQQIESFLSEHPEYECRPLPLTFPESLRAEQTPFGLQLLGCRDGVEGFFICVLRRVR